MGELTQLPNLGWVQSGRWLPPRLSEGFSGRQAEGLGIALDPGAGKCVTVSTMLELPLRQADPSVCQGFQNLLEECVCRPRQRSHDHLGFEEPLDRLLRLVEMSRLKSCHLGAERLLFASGRDALVRGENVGELRSLEIEILVKPSAEEISKQRICFVRHLLRGPSDPLGCQN